MNGLISFNENGIYVVFEITEDLDVRLLHFSSLPYDSSLHKNAEQRKRCRLVEVQVTGENEDDHHGSKHTRTNPGFLLKYLEHRDYRNKIGRKLEIKLQGEGLIVICHMQFYDGISAARTWTEIRNVSHDYKGIEYVSSFALSGIDKEGIQNRDRKCRLYAAHNTWYGEMQWKKYSLSEIGLTRVNDFTLKRISCSSQGTWPTSEYLPVGCFENVESGTSLMWQIEHNGAWYYELGEQAGQIYVQLSGPTENESHWWKNLKPGETFVSVPAAVCPVRGGFEKAAGEMTEYRRRIRRRNEDNRKLYVIFNDYANCLNGDPTADKLKPLIDAASDAGCEVFCIDAGWYSDGEWWDGVGEWIPSKRRFPNGIQEVLDYIRCKGMIPGLWLEIEVMGINCPLAGIVSDEWFFVRHRKRVIDHGRYQLDFRNRDVVKYADSIVDRLIKDYKVGYIKMDYNINGGIGTEVNADSFGDGLLEHNRAYLKWIDSVFDRYPNLIIENCASGGMRMDYATLNRFSIQSLSDQSDFKKLAVICAAAPSAVPPEQCGVWSYPSKECSREDVIFNMVNAMLLRIQQSGDIISMSYENVQIVREGISYYKKLRCHIPESIPVWPLGLPSFDDGWISMGLKCKGGIYLAVWRLDGDNNTCAIPFKGFDDGNMVVRCSFPFSEDVNYSWDGNNHSLKVCFKDKFMARIFEISAS